MEDTLTPIPFKYIDHGRHCPLFKQPINNDSMFSNLRSIWTVFLHMFHKRETVLYPEEKAYLPPRWRGRIVLTRDPEGEERCVGCYLCAAACPVGCIALQAAEDENGRRY